MTTSERDELIYSLAIDYIAEKENCQVFLREKSSGYYIALGKLSGACMVLNLDFTESEDDLTVFTNIQRKIVIKIEKENR